MNKYYAIQGVIILCIIGLMALSIRSLMKNDSTVPTGDRAWRLNVEFNIRADKRGSIIKLAPPWATKYSRVYTQNLIHPRFKIQRQKESIGSRHIVAVSTRSGELKFMAAFNIYLSTTPRFTVVNLINLSAELRESTLQPEEHIQVTDPEIRSVLDTLIKANTEANQLPLQIFKYVRNTLKISNNPSTQDAVSVLKRKTGNALGQARAMVALCRAATVPARIVAGFKLEETRSANPYYWVEVWQNNKWLSYDIVNGYEGEIPSSYIPLRRGSEHFYEITNAALNKITVDITELDIPKGMFSTTHARVSDILDLSRLPMSIKLTLSTLLLLPLGALLTTFFRNVIGIRTYGTFIPTLLALSALHVDWVTASFIIFFIAVFGLGGRSMLPGLKLSKVPRLSIVLTLVTLLITISISFMDYLSLNPSGIIVLLPIVVLTTLVDRIYSIIDENGIRTAVIRLVWTLIVAVICFAIFLQNAIGEWLLFYPEMHFFTIALIILFGQYRGKKITDITSLSYLVEPKPVAKPKLQIDNTNTP